MSTLPTLLSLPTDLQARIISLLPRHMHLTVLQAAPSLRPAVRNQKRSVIHVIDLAPSQADLPQPAEPAVVKQLQHYFILSVLVTRYDLRILHLTSGIDHETTSEVLRIAQSLCKNLESIAFAERGKFAETSIANMVREFRHLKSLRLIDVGSPAMQSSLHALAVISAVKPSSSPRDNRNLIFSDFRPNMLRQLVTALQNASSMLRATRSSEIDYRNEEFNGLLNLTVSFTSTGNHLDEGNVSWFIRKLSLLDSASMGCLNSLEVQIPRNIYSFPFNAQFSRYMLVHDLHVKQNSVPQKFVPPHMSTIIQVINFLRLEVPQSTAPEVPGARRAAKTQEILNYELLLDEYIHMGPKYISPLPEASGFKIFDSEKNRREKSWRAPVRAADVNGLHQLIRHYSPNVASIYLQCVIRHETSKISFEKISRSAELGVKWTAKLLSDFPSVRRLSCPRRLILSLENSDVSAMFRTCGNIEILHLLNDLSEAVPVGRGIIRNQCNILTNLQKFIRFLLENFAKLSCVYMETTNSQLNNTEIEVRLLLEITIKEIDNLEVRRPKMDVVTVRHQIEEWMTGNEE